MKNYDISQSYFENMREKFFVKENIDIKYYTILMDVVDLFYFYFSNLSNNIIVYDKENRHIFLTNKHLSYSGS